ncbi:MAG: SDR family NAD(P)-dependent oxidoreductase [Pseudomonadota bacterium]
MQQTVLITGANGGLGQALVAAAYEAGHRVVALVRDSDAAAALASSLPAGQLCCVGVQDLAHPKQLAACAESLGLDHIDVLINNAGTINPGPLEQVSLADAEVVFAVNYFSPLALIQAVLPGMRRRRSGKILNVSSLSAHAGLVTDGVYAASKAALERSAESLRSEVLPLGISVTNIVLGRINTTFGQTSAAITDSAYRPLLTYLAAEPANEGDDPAQIAAAIVAIIKEREPPLTVGVGAQASEVLEQLQGLSPAARSAWLEEISAAGWWRAHKKPGQDD